MSKLSFSWFKDRAAICVRERRMPYAYYQLKSFLSKNARRTYFFFYQIEYLISYARYRWRLFRNGGRPTAHEWDLVFVVKKNAPGWILDGICREIARYYPGRHTTHYAEETAVLPPAKAYFFSHYSFFSRCFRKTPHIWGAETLVWFPHPKDSHPGDIRRLVYALNKATKVICPCSSNLPLLTEWGVKTKKLTFILGGADPDLFKPHERGAGAVGFCTAYYERKSPDLMLEIIRSMPHRKFILLGPQSSHPSNAHRKWDRYSRFKEMLSLPNFTYIEAAYADYPKYYAQMDVLVSTSKVEGGPIPLIEAMMCNIVPVASNTGFAQDIIKHGDNGFIFGVDSKAAEVCALIEKAFDLKTDVRRSAQHLTWENFSREVQKLLSAGLPVAARAIDSGPVKIGQWWFPYDDKKCRRHFEDRGLQIDHLEKAFEYVTDWSTAVDGGAHVGSWARLLAGRFGAVYAYELAPDTYECLKKNTSDLANVKAVNAAIGEKPGRVGIREVGHTLGRGVGEGSEVPMLRLDDENLPSLGFLKLDLEGYEYFGLRGAKRSIAKFRPVILVEEKGHGQKYGTKPDASTRFLRSQGYKLAYRIKPDNIFVPMKQNPLMRFLYRIWFRG